MNIQASHRLDQITTYYFARKLAEIDQMNAAHEVKVINLGIGSPDLPPHQSVIDSLQASTSLVDAHKYQSYKGLPTLRAAFASWYQQHFHVTIDPSTEILPLIGSKEGVMHISMSLLDPGDEVLIPNPGYPSYESCTRIAGGVPVDMPLVERLGWQPDLDELARRDLSKVKLMWLNYPNMPTGAQVDKRFFDRVIEFAAAHNIIVCHDNPYSLILSEDFVSIFQSDPDKNHSIELVSLSKNYNMAGWRIGALVGHKKAVDIAMTFKSNMDSGMFRPLQESAITALGLDASWTENLNAAYRPRKEAACAILEHLGLQFDREGAGLFVWGKLPDTLPSAEVYADQILHEARVFITPGFIFGDRGERYLRISLCSPLSDMEESLNRIKNAGIC
jgi:LL-diaminopimelate aminotransferase